MWRGTQNIVNPQERRCLHRLVTKKKSVILHNLPLEEYVGQKPRKFSRACLKLWQISTISHIWKNSRTSNIRISP